MKSFNKILSNTGLLTVTGAVSILTFCAALTSTPCFAEWQLVDENMLGKVYIDPDRMKKSTSYPEVWQLTDLKSRASTGVLSRQILIQYDCVDRKRRTLASSGHPDHMAKSKPIFTDVSQGAWHPVPKDTVLEKILDIACEKEDYAKTLEEESKAEKNTEKEK
jgi:hypothetical protein